MTATDAAPPAEIPPVRTPTGGALPWIYVLAVFCGAAMVFMVQPMVAKLVLPQLGGSPQVWNTSMAFFQGALLVGYGYAHFLQKVPRARTQVLIHLGVMLLAATLLPLRITTLLGEPGAAPPALWLLGVLAISIGAPFAALSATAPLVQAWHAKIHGRDGGPEPWALYAASNLGSLLALLAYPVIVEPLTVLHDQRWGWSLMYGVFVVIMAVLAVTIRRTDTRPPLVSAVAEPGASPMAGRWRQRLTWIALAALPSSLMLGVTAHLTTDVASAPFLWVAPLALYLLTFILAFQSRPKIPPQTALVIMSTVLIVCVATLPFRSPNVLATLGIHLLTFFLCALVCHQALVARRPEPARLTDFYLCMSVGGVVGGAFNAFVAPVIFNTVVEYGMVLALCALVRPFGSWRWTAKELIAGGIAILGACLAVVSASRAFGGFLDAHPTSFKAIISPVLVAGFAILLLAAAIAYIRRSREPGLRPRLEAYAFALAAILWIAALSVVAVSGARTPGIDAINIIGMVVGSNLICFFGAALLIRRQPQLAFQPTGRERAGLILAVVGFDLLLLALGGVFSGGLVPSVNILRALAAVGVVVVAVVAVSVRERAVPFFIAIALLGLSAQKAAQDSHAYESRRSFFGVVHFSMADIPGIGPVKVFSHGTTLHGAQAQDAKYRCRPLTYYAPETAIGQVMRTTQAAKPAITIGAVGLGTGAISAYVRPTDRMTFFEIDPQVVAVSSDPKYFSYTTQCAKGPIDYVVGDARLTLEKLPPASFDLLLIDAFSSDAIPAHLLTVEALKGYLARIKPDGVVVLHLSNRHLELVFPAASVARAAGGYALFQGYRASPDSPYYWESSEDVMIVAHSKAALAAYVADPRWLPTPPPTVRPWTDDYTNLVGALLGGMSGRRPHWQQQAEDQARDERSGLRP